jgi:GNAT superfamily N-acetyltransferase
MAELPTTAEQTMLAAAYAAFNARDIDAVLQSMHPDVEWPKGMEGGYVHGHDEVRSYWTRQWALVNPHVEPVRVSVGEEGMVVLDVRQVVRDLSGTILIDQMVQHAYRVERGLIRRMEIRPVVERHPVTIRREGLDGEAARSLIPKLNAELSAVYPEPGANHFGLSPAEVAPGQGTFLVAYRGDRPVGCGAVRLIDPVTAELKRMYVEPKGRGEGIGRALVEALESEARQLGAKRLVLETGIRQVAAVALYERCGFAAIPLYGEYCLSPETSLCLGKTLAR